MPSPADQARTFFGGRQESRWKKGVMGEAGQEVVRWRRIRPSSECLVDGNPFPVCHPNASSSSSSDLSGVTVAEETSAEPVQCQRTSTASWNFLAGPDPSNKTRQTIQKHQPKDPNRKAQPLSTPAPRGSCSCSSTRTAPSPSACPCRPAWSWTRTRASTTTC